jgi:hypothetical protein
LHRAIAGCFSILHTVSVIGGDGRSNFVQTVSSKRFSCRSSEIERESK